LREPAWRTPDDPLDTPLEPSPVDGARFDALPESGAKSASYEKWKRHLRGWLHRERRLAIWHAPSFKLWSDAGESKSEFLARVRMQARESRDEQLERAKESYGMKIATVTERIRRAQQKVARERDQYESARSQTAISFGATVLGALFGRKLRSTTTLGRATSTMRGAGSAAQQRADVDRAQDDVATLVDRLKSLEHELESELDRIAREHDERAVEVEAVEVAPRKSDIEVETLRLAWSPT
jgi:hypothetical protein